MFGWIFDLLLGAGGPDPFYVQADDAYREAWLQRMASGSEAESLLTTALLKRSEFRNPLDHPPSLFESWRSGATPHSAKRELAG